VLAAELAAFMTRGQSMSCKVATGIVALTAFVGIGSMALSAQDNKSQWDGVYTEEQAKRGEKLYAEKCASCHGQDLNGGEMAPGLVGGEFSANWNELSLGDLFERMRISMPQNDPGSLSRDENADVLAYMLARGAAPAGKSELPSQTDALHQFKFLAMNPHPSK
jgi:mono/diheme cytochrome c family protein